MPFLSNLIKGNGQAADMFAQRALEQFIQLGSPALLKMIGAWMCIPGVAVVSAVPDEPDAYVAWVRLHLYIS